MSGQGHHKNVFTSIAITCLAYALFSTSKALVKKLGVTMPTVDIIFLNGLCVFVLFALYGLIKEGKAAFRTKKPKLMFWRATLSLCTTGCVFYALPHVPLTTFYLLVFTSPLWIIILSALFMGEALNARRITLILTSFAAIAVAFQPGSGMFDIWAFIILGGTLLYSAQVLVMRQIGLQESRIFILLSGAVMGLCAMIPFLSAGIPVPTLLEGGLVLLIALFSGCGTLALSYAYQLAPSATLVASYHYTQIIWATLLGYFLFAEIPNTRVIIAAGVIIALGVYMAVSEKKSKKLLRST